MEGKVLFLVLNLIFLSGVECYRGGDGEGKNRIVRVPTFDLEIFFSVKIWEIAPHTIPGIPGTR